jgi:hypothetical protein
MAKIATRDLALAALGAFSMNALLSPAFAKAPSLEDTYSACRKEVRDVWPGYGDGSKDRMRDSLFNACVMNGGKIPN